MADIFILPLNCFNLSSSLLASVQYRLQRHWTPQPRSQIQLKYFSENYFNSLTMLLQREPFLTMLYTTNSSPLLIAE